MLRKITCGDAQKHLQRIQTLEQQLNECLFFITKQKISSRDIADSIEEAQKLKIILDQETENLIEQVNPFERLFNLREQYQSQIRVLEAAKILEEREINGERVKGHNRYRREFSTNSNSTRGN